MSSYDSFAPFYDIAMGDRKEIALALRAIIKRHAPKAKTLIELGCGSGSLLKILSNTYSCFGIDLSSQMIRVARKKVPHAEFKVANISKFRLDKKFDVVLCVFDTINHLLTFKEWQALFKHVRDHLNPSGVFIFDINTERKIDRYDADPPFAEFTNDAVSIFEVSKKNSTRYTVSVKVFKKKQNKNYVLNEITIDEATFPVTRILKELSRHFKNISFLDLDRKKATDATEELYFICKGLR